jgi:formylglycine-generating enzyme required for sulfatase activity
MKKLPLGLAILGLCGSLLANPGKFAIEMVRIPGGTFQMGSNCGRDAEKPLHKVSINTFYLGRTAVTVGQFRAFVAESGYRTEAERGDGSVVFTGRKWEKRREADWCQPGFGQNDSHPVTCVSWNDCQEFIRWLNGKTGRSYRLPTEAEWEYAARGGDSGDGNGDLGRSAWFEGNSGNSTRPVGQKLPNAYGLCDMIGNVWEWCSDWYGSYSSAPQADPTGPDSGSSRINRGGAWYGATWDCRTRRGKNTPDDRGNGLGFRLAADAVTEKMGAGK